MSVQSTDIYEFMICAGVDGADVCWYVFALISLECSIRAGVNIPAETEYTNLSTDNNNLAHPYCGPSNGVHLFASDRRYTWQAQLAGVWGSAVWHFVRHHCHYYANECERTCRH